MELLSYFLVSLAAYAGAVAGYVLMLVAPEEKEAGMRYFNVINYFVFFLAIALLIFFRQELMFVLIALVSAVVFCLFRKYQIYIAYLFFSFAFYFLSSIYNAFLIISIVIFAYGLAAGAIMASPKDRKKSFFKVASLSYFILLANLLMITL